MPQPPTEPRAASGAQGMRMVLLVSGISLFVAGLLLRYSTLVEPASREFVGGTLLKVAMVVGLAWLAAPQLERLGWQKMRGTTLAIIAVIGVLTALRPRFGAIAAGIVIGGFVVLAMVGWVRGVIFSGARSATIDAKTGKIEKNPTRR